MLRRLFRLLSILFLILVIGIGMLFVRSLFRAETLQLTTIDQIDSATYYTFHFTAVDRGRIGYAYCRARVKDNGDLPLGVIFQFPELGLVHKTHGTVTVIPKSHPVFDYQNNDLDPYIRGYHVIGPLWVLLLASMVFPVTHLALYLFRRRRLGSGATRCPACGYDLRATPTQCPECGRVTANLIAPSPAKR